MATIKGFEELEIWQLASIQCNHVFELIEDGRFDFDTPLADQINHSSGSVMDHIAEGFDRFNKADFRHFLIISRGSNAEVRSQLYRTKARKHITHEEADKLIQQSRHLGTKINNLIQYLDKFDHKTKTESGVLAEPDTRYINQEYLFYDLPPQFIIAT